MCKGLKVGFYRLSPELMEWLKAKAAEKTISQNAWVTKLLSDAMLADRSKPVTIHVAARKQKRARSSKT